MIVLVPFSVSPFGDNDLQCAPTITSAVAGATSTTISGTLTSAPLASFTLDFYASDTMGSQQGQVYLGSRTVSTDAAGNAPFDVPFPVSAGNREIRATATDPVGKTSEVSTAISTAALDGPTGVAASFGYPDRPDPVGVSFS